MNPVRAFLFSAVAAVGLGPSMVAAQAYQAVNLLQVVPLSQTDFEVIEARGEGARGMWCAAADFAINRLGILRNERLYIKSPRGRSVSGAGRIGAVFTTDAASLSVPPSRSYSVTVRDTGVGLPLHHAYQFCKDYIIELEDILYYQRKR